MTKAVPEDETKYLTQRGNYLHKQILLFSKHKPLVLIYGNVTDSIDFRRSSCYCINSHKTRYKKKDARGIYYSPYKLSHWLLQIFHLMDSRLIYDQENTHARHQ